MSSVGVILKEKHMSTAVKAPTDTPISVSAPRDHRPVWTTVLILGVIAACAIGASFYIDAPVVDASMVGP
jgi:hypothetical protein